MKSRNKPHIVEYEYRPVSAENMRKHMDFDKILEQHAATASAVRTESIFKSPFAMISYGLIAGAATTLFFLGKAPEPEFTLSSPEPITLNEEKTGLEIPETETLEIKKQAKDIKLHTEAETQESESPNVPKVEIFDKAIKKQETSAVAESAKVPAAADHSVEVQNEDQATEAQIDKPEIALETESQEEEVEILAEPQETAKENITSASLNSDAMPVIGFDRFYAFLDTAIIYPEKLRNKRKIADEVTVLAEFDVDEFGTIKNISIGKAPHKAFKEEAVRILETMPKWKPAIENGKAVSSRFSLSFQFYKEK
ncbi:hypothetical protein FUAX_15010 [Fulvitalea axinellae]|uniref:TonB C-terminal domain-containing protein n=1 Tax=Fulvitalea axinellae TaxID=1182444 RepID=A0AAU9CRK2_9BACT|nr:hypothetical protein FUAX_15010 [Fulvitalea axinellae]